MRIQQLIMSLILLPAVVLSTHAATSQHASDIANAHERKLASGAPSASRFFPSPAALHQQSPHRAGSGPMHFGNTICTFVALWLFFWTIWCHFATPHLEHQRLVRQRRDGVFRYGARRQDLGASGCQYATTNKMTLA